MIHRVLISVTLAYVLITTPAAAANDASREPSLLSGKVGVTGKYDSDMTLTLGQYGQKAHSDDAIEEVSATVELDKTVNENWHLNLEIQGLGNWPLENRNSTWYVGNSNLYIGYARDKNTISLLDTSRYFTVPGDRHFDFFRNSATLSYKRVLSERWELGIGYENIANAYMKNADLNYILNGGLLELRNPWTPLLSTYYTYGFHYYRGKMGASQEDGTSSLSGGFRHTAEIGLDWVFAGKNNVTAAYIFQVDNSEQDNWVQHGDFQGDQGSLESEADFNFIKNKGTLLFSHRFNKRFSLTLYNEFIYKHYLSRALEGNPVDTLNGVEVVPARTDMLFLTSAWLSVRLLNDVFGKIRYIFRMNESTQNEYDYTNHIGSIGLEFHF
jgi:hypothetical protein